jgi:hypothetical protein
MAKAKATKRQARPRSSRRSNGVAIPNALSKRDRVAAIAETLQGLQREELAVTLQQEANGDADTDRVPGLAPGRNGEVVTYAMRRKVFTDGQARIAAQHRDLMPQVRAYIAGAHSQQE